MLTFFAKRRLNDCIASNDFIVRSLIFLLRWTLKIYSVVLQLTFRYLHLFIATRRANGLNGWLPSVDLIESCSVDNSHTVFSSLCSLDNRTNIKTSAAVSQNILHVFERLSQRSFVIIKLHNDETTKNITSFEKYSFYAHEALYLFVTTRNDRKCSYFIWANEIFKTHLLDC